jgi:glucose-1-phosphate thymidylyltransferase
VEIAEGTRVESSDIRGPVSIAANCQIINSYIGPYTSVGANTLIENSSVEYSVILNNAHIRDIQHLTDSVIGRNAEVVRQEQESARLFIGDYDKVEL